MGKGIDPASSAAAGLGLKSMKERIEALSGTFVIQSQPGQGTSLLAKVPWNELAGWR